MKKLNVMKKGTKITIISVVATLMSILLVLSGMGIYFAFKKDKSAGPKHPGAVVNPIGFSVDKWDGSSVSNKEFIPSYAGRSGDSYTIDSAQSFIYFIEQANAEEFQGKVYLNCSIDLAGYEIPSIKYFNGEFDGGFYNILNANINGNALFERTENTTIKNLGMYNCTINGTDTGAGLINKANDTNIENVFVRLGEIKGTTTSGLVSEFNSASNHISNSFVDANKITYGLVGSVEGEMLINTCYYTNANSATPDDTVFDGIIHNPTSSANFNVWPTYSKTYNSLADWSDYSYIANSQVLNFNYPVQSGFVKVYTTGSYYEGVITANGNYVDDLTSLSSAVEMGSELEINLIVERVMINETVNAAASSRVTISSEMATTLVRGNKNTGSLISATAENSKVVLGDNLTLDGNSEYVKANQVQSGALITLTKNNVEFGNNVTLKNNINNQTAGGALLILGEQITLSGVNIEKCSSVTKDAAICVVGSNINLIDGRITNCQTGVYIANGNDSEVIDQIKASYGNSVVSKLSTSSNTTVTATTIDNYIITNCIGEGVYVEGDVTITNSIIANNTSYGVLVDGKLILSNTTITGNRGTGVYTKGSVTINADSDGDGIKDGEGCIISGNGMNGVYVDDQYGLYGASTITDSTISNNYNYGVCLLGYTYAIITNSIISNNGNDGVCGDDYGAGINIDNCSITNNGGDGVNCSWTTVTNSTISGNVKDGVWSMVGSTIENTQILNNKESGVTTYDTAATTSIKNSVISGNGVGVRGTNETTTIISTIISDNMFEGVSLSYSQPEFWPPAKLTVSNSSIINNRSCGVYLAFYEADSPWAEGGHTIVFNADSNGDGIDDGDGCIISGNGSAGMNVSECTKQTTITLENTSILSNGAEGIKANEVTNRVESLSLTNSIISNNGSHGFVGAGFSGAYGWVAGTNVTLTNSSVTENGGDGVCAETLTATNSTISNNASYGARIKGNAAVSQSEIFGNGESGVAADGSLTVDDSLFSGNTIHSVYGGRTVIIRNSEITNTDGSGVYIASSGSVEISDSLVAGSSNHGVLITNGNGKITNTIITDNGGRGLNSVSGTLIVENSFIINNQNHGVYASSNIQITDSTVSENGFNGIFTQSGSITMENTHAINNQSSGVIATTGSISIQNSAICDNNSQGVGTESGNISVRNTVIMDNGGQGIISETGNVTLNVSEIINNGGHGIYTAGTVYVGSSIVSANKHTNITSFGTTQIHSSTISDGSEVGVYSAKSIEILNSVISDNGSDGVRNVNGGVTAKIEDSIIINNFGMGVYASGSSVEILTCIISNNGSHGVAGSHVLDTTITITSSTISENGNYGVAWAKKITITDSQILYNEAGIGNASCSIVSGSIISGNDNWGVLSGELTIEDTIITNNGADGVYSPNSGKISTIKNATISGNGGSGVYGFDVDIEHSAIYNNAMSGVVVDGVTNILYCTISDNGSFGVSGDTYHGSAYISHTTISGNKGQGIGVLELYGLVDSIITNNAGDGVYSTGNQKISNTTITGNGGYGVYSKNGFVTINADSDGDGTKDGDGCIISGNGRDGVCSPNLSDISTIKNATISGNGGCGVYGFDVDIEHSVIYNNAMFGIVVHGVTNILYCTISDNGSFGVSDYGYGGSAYISHTTISGNKGKGVGVFELYGLVDSIITNNTGDGVYTYGSGDQKISNTTITGNGGYGVYASGSGYCYVTINADSDGDGTKDGDGCVISGNGIDGVYGVIVDVEHSAIYNNAMFGIHITHVTSILYCTIYDNGSDGVYGHNDSASAFISHTTISSNKGVGVSVDRLHLLEDSIIANNTGDGVYLEEIPLFNDPLIASNSKIVGNGGYGLNIATYGASISDCVISENVSGGVNYYREGLEGAITLEISKTEIINNNGHGVYSSGSITITNSTIADNTGKAVFWGDSSDYDYTEVYSCSISDSEINGNGYGVHYNGKLIIEDTTISNNNGNAIYAYYPDGEALVSNCNIFDNAGGVGIEGGEVRDTVISNNGGAFAIDCYLGLEIIGSQIINNSGGGVYSGNCTTIINSEISKITGTAICSVGLLTITGSTVANNKGVAIHATDDITIDNSTILNNTTSSCLGEDIKAFVIYGEGCLSISNSKIIGNTYTGTDEVYAILGYGNAEIVQTEITGNSAGVYIDDSDLMGLTYSNNRGRIYLNGDSYIADSEFVGNTSADNGGVIYTISNLTIEQTKFVGNKSNGNGGAIHTEGELTINSGCAFYGNVATENGGAIYTTGLLTLADTGMIYGNYAVQGDDLYTVGETYYTGETLTKVDKGYETSVYYGNDYAVTGAIAAITTSNENAGKVIGGMVVENGNNIAADTNNVVFIDSGYQIYINPNGGLISYTTGTGDGETTQATADAITLYAAKDSKKLYTSIGLTTEVTAINLSRDGYTSTGIYNASTGGAQFIGAGSSEFTLAYSNSSVTTLFAQWSPTLYTISYDLGDGTLSGNNPTTYTIESADITFNNPTQVGYTFVGWNDGTTTTETVTISTGSFGNKTYTAVYTINKYTVTWVANGSVLDTNIVDYLTQATYNGEIPTKTGSSFVGWSVDGGKTVIAELGSVYIVEDLTFTAVFHTISISVNNVDYGTVSSSSVEADLSGGYDITSLGNVITIESYKYVEYVFTTDDKELEFKGKQLYSYENSKYNRETTFVEGKTYYEKIKNTAEIVTAEEETGYIFDKWVVTPDYEKQETKIVAIFNEAITVTINATGSKLDNAYGIIVMKDGAEVGRYDAKQNSNIQLVKNGNYIIHVYANLMTNVSTNEYQILKIKVNSVDRATYDSAKKSVIQQTVFVTTEEDKLEGNLTIDLEYIAAYLMQVEYTSNNIIEGISNVTSTDGIVINRVSDLGGYIISKGSTVNFAVNANIKTGVTLTKDYNYAKLTYITTSGETATQGYIEAGKAIYYVGVEDLVYSYTTTLEIAKLTIGVLVQVVEFNTTNLDWSAVNFTSLVLTSQEGHNKEVTQATGVLNLYASSWKIDLPSGATSSISELQKLFNGIGMVTTYEGSFYLMVS